ncbi:Uncharacterised protein [[Clostridium] sordellii]|uniref:Membrane protein n=1 Tax=Paraclostridium sordellii TaxID=1505 RepID=A0ABM9RKE4_PARSO|nr:hypothetical protein [Paeniclostridium sordellii]EPZ62445.1 putative membrane protein [[Clostridium] sordellii ATCC 9714] [Paeniclostridium sordellii ATCC 9714]CEJ72495.1 putative membrane protein [[Clostridium] sordellii] [Paeniclostridium sordellii]CEN22373.1 Uncharacterised protein [[Clostridium] sordellii] [Paeniclostridium sordellii]CEN29676.1 Uncharacterised protein [[Clostridium] sordellii] [Paeniclostridium sordellii]CEO28949.1 Uncharacterised protein [[Clostridium] sordellii] [Paen
MGKYLVRIIKNIILIILIAYGYMYFTESLHVTNEPIFKLIVITFLFSSMIIIGLKLFFENNKIDNNIDID